MEHIEQQPRTHSAGGAVETADADAQ